MKPFFHNVSYVLQQVFALVLALSLLVAMPVAAEEKQPTQISMESADIRLLIDISGSMKKNDPANLRIPAVNLLTELIPDGGKAGVWTFGQWVNNLIRHQAVDDTWRTYAKTEAKKINSVALFTNIGGVLEKASQDFVGDQRFDNTHFILLTDGMVDIDQDPEKNAAERERILGPVVNKIRSKGARIHAVALSSNADQSLMEKLAVFTGGQFALAETPEDLTRIFLQALDQAVPTEQVPIEGNSFDIDSSIEEFTALIFRDKSGVSTEILGPDEKSHSASKHADYVKWYQQEGYDLITVNRPMEGTWKIKTGVAPGSRVTVVSNLQLDVSKLPVNFFPGESLAVEVSFSEAGNRITNPDFLSLLEVSLAVKTEAGKQGRKIISDAANLPADGVFRDAITKLTEMGAYEVTVLVDGKTFKRQHRQLINLRSPFDFEFSVVGQGDAAHYQLVVAPLSPTVDVAQSTVFAKVKAPDDSSLIKAVELDQQAQRWRLALSPDKGDGLYKVSVKVKGKSLDGKEFEFSPKAFDAEFPIPVAASARIVSVNVPEPEPAPVVEVPTVPEPVPEVRSEPEVQEPTEPEVPVSEDESLEEAAEESGLWLWLAIGAGVLALAAAAGGGFMLWRARKKSAQSADDEPGEVLTDEVVEEIMDDPVPMVGAPAVVALGEELDFVEDSEQEAESEAAVLEAEEEIVDLSVGGDLSMDSGAEELEPPQDDEDDMADIAAAIEAGADEEPDKLKDEEEAALDIKAAEEDDDDEEFNLEDFDIGETDDVPDTKKP